MRNEVMTVMFGTSFSVTFILFCSLTRTAVAKCPEIACETGTSCDFNTGICRRFRLPGEGLQNFALDWNKCQDVVCPPGYHCDGTSGVCTRIKPLQTENINLCEGIICPPEFSCSEGKCIRDVDLAIEDMAVSTVCQNIRCPTGFACSPMDGICRRYTKMYSPSEYDAAEEPFKVLEDEALTLVKCSANAHYEECTAPCTATCMDIRPACKQHDYECIRTCVCDDGFVQTSALNLTCVPAKECERIAREGAFNCQNLQCSPGMNCLDGYCNPASCPPALKPPMTADCHKAVLVRDRRNCVSLLNECSLKN